MTFSFSQLLEAEDARLKKYAVSSLRSQGRIHEKGTKKDNRLPFQKDRDRVMHCRAFRRLQGKTQVFVVHGEGLDHGDHFRTRLTHSIEVAQISRDLARAMGLNEDLSEAIALAHDLGHTPFGHAGQDELNELMKKYGPENGLTEENSHFEHNEQSLRIVDKLENIYPTFRGLNLSHEVREGLMKHQTSWDNAGKEITARPALEAQIVNLADEIAYNAHDIDDGLRAGILKLDSSSINEKCLADIELWQRALESVQNEYGTSLSERHLISRTVSSVISIMITDVITHSQKLLQENSIQTLEDVYAHPKPLISFSPEMLQLNANLKSYLAKEFYFSPPVQAFANEGQKTIKNLFEHYLSSGKDIIEIKDYIAGMTDDFARKEALSITN
ncbi:dNTP triphosphohydrolase [Candidatus Peregrinibacteria bacterium]|jgi:dGTPase|nr:dNTP triphosphohydrolase [Candidatus Peregrinibacteria bacterium]